jgi:hypothetical protein
LLGAPPSVISATRSRSAGDSDGDYHTKQAAFEHSHLMPDREGFEGPIASTSDEGSDRRENGQDEFWHELTLLTSSNAARPGKWNVLKPLIL